MTKRSDLAPGVWGDGTFGHQHTRVVCAEVLRMFGGPKDVEAELFGDMSDDAQEENDACDWLTDHVAPAGYWFGWDDGDFGLWPDNDE
jgi:S-formylglutathione hydrolase FrmB